MKQHFIRIITASALFILLTVQIIWLYHSYMFVKTELSNKASIMLEQAIMDETFNRTYLLPVGTWVEGRSINDIGKNIPEFGFSVLRHQRYSSSSSKFVKSARFVRK